MIEIDNYHVLARIFKEAPAAMAVLQGPKYKYIEANDLFCTLINRTKEELIGKETLELFPELEDSDTIRIYDEIYSTGTGHVGRQHLFKWDKEKDGNIVEGYFDYVSQPMLNESGEATGLIIFAYEVTDQVLAIKKAQQAEKEFRQIADYLPQIVWTARPDGYLDYYNKQWYDYTGFEEGYGDQSWTPIMHPDDVEYCHSTFYECIRTGAPYQIYYRFKDRKEEGRYRWFMGRANPVRDESGNIIKWFGSCTDIDDQKSLSETLEQKVAERTKMVDTLNKSFEHAEKIALMGNFRVDFSENQITWSRNLYTLFDVTPETFTPTLDSILKFTHPDDAERLAANAHKAFETQSALPITYRVITALGVEKYMVGTGEIVIDDHGNKYMIGTLQDITASKLLELDLQQKNKKLESFAYISSHDLQEPLRKIKIFTDMISEDETSQWSKRSEQYFEKISQATTRMQTLITDLLTFSGLGTDGMQMETINFNMLADDLIEDFNEDVQQLHGEIKSTGDCKIKVIPFQFRQLLQNLISNALKFSKPDVAPIIELSCNIVDGTNVPKWQGKNRKYALITVSDNGIGFSSEYKDRIFEIFQRLHTRDQVQGTGIGLAIVKKIVENHNGYITADGEVGVGATFNIYLPVD